MRHIKAQWARAQPPEPEYYARAPEPEPERHAHASILNLKAPYEVYVGESFTVNLTVSYDFSLATYVGAGISDPEIVAWVELEYKTFYGEGTEAYSFELMAPEEETTQIFEASVWYYSEDEWIHGEVDWVESFDIKVIEPEPEPEPEPEKTNRGP